MVMQHISPAELAAPNAQFDKAVARAQLFGEHVWIATALYRVEEKSLAAAHAEGGEPLLMDRENLVHVGYGCWVCEEPYTSRLAHRRCKGEPR